MSIADSLEHLTDDIKSAYEAINEKGGTIPEHKNTENLGDSIASIPSGGSEDPGDWGLIEYWTKIVVNVSRINSDNCTAEIVDEDTFAKAVMNMEMGGSTFWLDLSYEQGSGWRAMGMQDPMTTAGLESTFGLQITDFDESSADWAMIMISGSIGYDKTIPTAKYLIKSLEEYESLAGDNPVIAPNSICKFIFGRAVTSVPDKFFYNVPNLEYMDTTFAGNITTIGNSCFTNNSTGVRNDIEFANVVSIGDNCFTSNFCKAKMSFPKVETIGSNCFSYNTLVGSAGTMSFPELREMGDGCFGGLTGYCLQVDLPKVERVGQSCFNNAEFTSQIRVQGWNSVQSIGKGFLSNIRSCNELMFDNVVFNALPSSGDTQSLTIYTQSCAYIAGIRVYLYNGLTQSTFTSRYPNSNNRKWRFTG